MPRPSPRGILQCVDEVTRERGGSRTFAAFVQALGSEKNPSFPGLSRESRTATRTRQPSLDFYGAAEGVRTLDAELGKLARALERTHGVLALPFAIRGDLRTRLPEAPT